LSAEFLRFALGIELFVDVGEFLAVELALRTVLEEAAVPLQDLLAIVVSISQQKVDLVVTLL
jgi:hypothetical protein